MSLLRIDKPLHRTALGFSRKPLSKRVFQGIFLVVAYLLLVMFPAAAHGGTKIGPYDAITGWRAEPVIARERNQIIFQILNEDGQLVENLETTLDVEIIYEERTFRGNLLPADAAGWYAIDLVPTLAGRYALHITGMIEDFAVDETLELDQVLPPAVLEFPKSQPDLFTLQAYADRLEQQIQTANTIAVIGIILGVIGSLSLVLQIIRRRS